MILIEMRQGEREVGARKKRIITDRYCATEYADKEKAIARFVELFAEDLGHESEALTHMLNEQTDFVIGNQHFLIRDKDELWERVL